MNINKKRESILIVEDSELINKTIFTSLSKFECYDLHRVFDFKSCSDMLEENSFDFILLDLNLPDAYGEELAESVQAMSKAKIIVLTAEADVQMRESLFKKGILDYLVKDKNFTYSINSIDKVIKEVRLNTDSNILIIDDSIFICKQMQSILAIRNYKTTVAQTAESGMEMLKSSKINTIILDMELPDKHGLELLREIKKEPTLCNIPVIVISASDNPETVRDAFKLGVSYFIKKPFNVEVFTLKVDLSIDINRKDIELLHNQKILDQYKEAVDESAIVSKTDVYGNITFTNDRFCEISGYTKEELLGKPHSIVRHPDTPKSAFKEMWETIQNKKTWRGKLKNLKKDGTSYWVSSAVSPIVDYDGNIVEYIGMRTDISDLEYIKQDLETSLLSSNKNFLEAYKISQEYKKAIDLANMLVRVSKDGIITHVNKKFCEILGYEKENLIGKNYTELRDPNISEDEYHKIFAYIAKGNIWRGQIQNVDEKGVKHHFESVVIPIFDDKGEILEYFVIRHDVTDIINLHQELESTQKDIIYKMGEVGESRSSETGFHVKRVAQYSKLLAELIGLDDKNADLIFTASPMHDIGKVGIPDSILLKPGKLDAKEWEIMKTHAEIGFDILKDSKRNILKAAAIVSYTHHEKYDGSGYPRGVAGEKIHIFGRITALADVFDALGSVRVYKKAWKLDDILELIKSESGKHFDPKLVSVFIDNIDKFLAIRDEFQDKKEV